MTSSPLRLSRAPVGSSAVITAAVHQRASDADALLLAARQLAGATRAAPAQPETVEQVQGALMPGRGRNAGISGRDLDIAGRRQVGHQVVALEDEAEALPAQLRQRIGVQHGDVPAVDCSDRHSAGRGSPGCSSRWTCPNPKPRRWRPSRRRQWQGRRRTAQRFRRHRTESGAPLAGAARAADGTSCAPAGCGARRERGAARLPRRAVGGRGRGGGIGAVSGDHPLAFAQSFEHGR